MMETKHFVNEFPTTFESINQASSLYSEYGTDGFYLPL